MQTMKALFITDLELQLTSLTSSQMKQDDKQIFFACADDWIKYRKEFGQSNFNIRLSDDVFFLLKLQIIKLYFLRPQVNKFFFRYPIDRMADHSLLLSFLYILGSF